MTVRIGIVGDPHFCPKSDDAPERSSHLIVPSVESSSDPLNSLIYGTENSPVLQEAKNPDLLICPGDITCYADKDALVCGWRELDRLSSRLGATALVGTVGNHDVESRPNPSGPFASPIDHLKLLEPPFPISIENKAVEYWGQGFAERKFVDKKLRIITLNSCEYHGTGLAKEYNRGRVGEPALKWLAAHLRNNPTDKDWIDILVCHHHPVQHGMHGLGEHDLMIGGEHLCSCLASTGKQWLIIHGHKHHSRITRAPVGAYFAPWVFASSSFAAVIDAKFASFASNQFFILEVDRKLNGSLQGIVRSWTWTHGLGWNRSTDGEKGLVDRVGFGSIINPYEMAERIAGHVSSASSGYLTWHEIYDREPELRYLLQDDVKSIIDALRPLVEVVGGDRVLFPSQLMKK